MPLHQHGVQGERYDVVEGRPAPECAHPGHADQHLLLPEQSQLAPCAVVWRNPLFTAPTGVRSVPTPPPMVRAGPSFGTSNARHSASWTCRSDPFAPPSRRPADARAEAPGALPDITLLMAA